MIETREMLLETIFRDAIKRINDVNTKKLVSFTKEIDSIDPLQFFEAAEHHHMERTFWSSTKTSFYMVGAGTVCPIVATENRFQETKRQWQEVVSQATIYNPYQVPGTGLTAIGGMRFDPKKQRTKLWKKFADSAFQIPQFMLVQAEQAAYLTINAYIDITDDVSKRADALRETAKNLLQGVEVLPEGAELKRVEEIDPEQWKEQVLRATKEIKQQKAEKIVLARELRLKLSKQTEIAPLLRRLMEQQTNSYVFAVERGDDCFVGATPERLVKLEREQLLSTCLAGTAPRGETIKEDQNIGQALLYDPKNRGEHDFVVQMIKQAMKQFGLDIEIPDGPELYPLKNLQHLYTPITATLKQGYSIFDIVEALHPTPALGGVPCEKSLAFIREHEVVERGWYGAPIGWLDSNQNGEFAVAIRSGLVQGDEVSLFAGCGVMKDSDPEAEYEETSIKFSPMLSIFGG